MRRGSRRNSTDAPDGRPKQHIEPREHPDGVTRDTLVNPAESPLAWLYRRKAADGRRLISEAQFRAGEVLRSDFTIAGLSARVTVDWTASPPGRGRKAGGRGPGDIMDAAIDARARLEQAFAEVGADFAGLLEDVCCYLIGIEEAERRRGWPRRSGKVVLDLALHRLAEHYGFQDRAVGRRTDMRRWSTPGYRPTIDGKDSNR
ncbi:MAG: DUF6456 domain-containing protein [Pseudomonadota bacterium]